LPTPPADILRKYFFYNIYIFLPKEQKREGECYHTNKSSVCIWDNKIFLLLPEDSSAADKSKHSKSFQYTTPVKK